MAEKIPFKRFGTFLDCSRNGVMNVSTVKRWVDTTEKMGYNTLLLYTEDTYALPDDPYFGHLRGRYSLEEIQEIDDYAAQKGMEVIPCIQTLAHLETYFKWRHTYLINDCTDILLSGDETVYQLIDSMFAFIKKAYRSNVVHAGMDEAFLLGRGQYTEKFGYKERLQVLAEHAERVGKIAEKHGLTVVIWGETEEMHCIPQNVQPTSYGYHIFSEEELTNKIDVYCAKHAHSWFAGGAWTWNCAAPHNGYGIDAAKRVLPRCLSQHIENYFLCLWGDNGGECSPFAALPCVYTVSMLAQGVDNEEQIKQGFEKMFGVPFDTFMLLDLPNTPNDMRVNDRPVNPLFYLMYNDCFLGKYDALVGPEDGAQFAACAQKLAAANVPADYRYLFTMLQHLCEVVALKADIGVRVKKAYQQGDRAALQQVADDYAVIIEKIQQYHESYAARWMLENKPQGFEVQDQRLGGLCMRLAHCRKRLLAYLSGELEAVPELLEPTLPCPIKQPADNKIEKRPILVDGLNIWQEFVTAGNM